LVLKSNRKGKVYICKNCGTSLDSDLNSAINNEMDLPEILYDLRRLKLNIKGFFWKPEGIFTLTGEALRVPHTNDEYL
jgi:hypothetical protein